MGRKAGERGTDRKIGRWSEPSYCSTSQEQERRSQKVARGGGTARGAMEKGGCVRFIEREEVRGDNLVEYFRPPFLSPKEGDGN